MLFSVCIPVYNTSKYLDKCLLSVLEQTQKDYEIILIDDGSTDNSGEICDYYAAQYPNIRVIHKENEGLMMTRRRGFLEARGDWFLCVDSDDYIKKNHLQTIADAIQKYNCDMVMFDYESFYPDGHLEPSGIPIDDIQVFEGAGKQKIYEKRLLKNKYNNMWSKAIKRSVVDFETDYSAYGVRNMCEDAIQSYELYTRAEKIVYIPQVLYAYRRSASGITSNIGPDYWHSLRVSYELGWEYVKRWNVSEYMSCAYATRCICFYCDFLTWLFGKSGLEEDQQRNMLAVYILKNEFFAAAAMKYRKKYLPTRYLRLRNPLLIKSCLANRSMVLAKRILQAERILRKL